MKAASLTNQMKLALVLSVGVHATALVAFRTVYTPPRLVGGGRDPTPALTVVLSPPQPSSREVEAERTTQAAPDSTPAPEVVPAPQAEMPQVAPSKPASLPTRVDPEPPSTALATQAPPPEAAPQPAVRPSAPAQSTPPATPDPTPLSAVSQTVSALDREGGSSDQSFVVTRALPRYRVNPTPPYPALARRRGQQGLVRLTVLVTPGGEAARVSIRHSSGFPLLDEAARLAVRRWQFEPARRGALPVQSEIEVPVQFRLAP